MDLTRKSGFRGSSSNSVRRRLETEDDIIDVPDFDYSDIDEKFKLTLVGRMFHMEGRSVDALIKHMPKPKIWDVEGRVKGTNLGKGKFQFDFDNERDLVKVLHKRPCHFNRWSFSLERWEPNINPDFPNSLVLWVKIDGIPGHYRKETTFRNIGKALGLIEDMDIKGARVKISLNADKPLQMERKVRFPNGDVVSATLSYEDLYRFCFTCKMVSHEEGTCPELNDTQREANRAARLEQKIKEELANQEMFSYPAALRNEQEKSSRNTRQVQEHSLSFRENRESQQRGEPTRNALSERDRNRDRDRDLRTELQNKREIKSKEVWSRIERPHKNYEHRERERYHPYSKTDKEALRPRHAQEEHYRRDIDRRSTRPERSLHYDRHRRERDTVYRKKDTPYTPDSQRTISDSYGTRPRTINVPSRVWRPVQERITSEDERTRMIKGKAPMSAISSSENIEKNDSHNIRKEHSSSRRAQSPHRPSTSAIETLLTDVQCKTPAIAAADKEKEKDLEKEKTMPHETPAPTAERIEALEEEGELNTEQDMTDAEMDVFIEEQERIIAEQDKLMDAEMVENDDLLADELETIGANPLSPINGTPRKNAQETKVVDSTKSPQEQEKPMTLHTSPKQRQETMRSKSTRTSQGKSGTSQRKQGSRSPDHRKLTASKKMSSLRAKASPKKKSNTTRSTSNPAARFPRTEVFPSSRKQNFAASSSGSVVFQKPPSTHD